MRYKAVFKNAVGSVEFSLSSGILIEKINSLTQQKASVKTTASNRPIGEKVDSNRVGPKTITVMGTISGASDAVRKQMEHVICPLVESKFIVDDTYELTVFVTESPDVERYAYGAKFSFSMLAPYPYWQQKDSNNVTLVGLKPMFRFPWNISDPNPFKFSEYVPVGYVTVQNSGDAPAYWQITFLALDEVTNPRVYNMETGAFVRILKTMNAGEQLTISTRGEELTITTTASDGTVSDGFQYLDIDSEPFLLAVGNNYIKTDADTNVAALRASIRYQQGYVGV